MESSTAALDFLAAIGLVAILCLIWVYGKRTIGNIYRSLAARSVAKAGAALAAQISVITPVVAPVVDRLARAEQAILALQAKVQPAPTPPLGPMPTPLPLVPQSAVLPVRSV